MHAVIPLVVSSLALSAPFLFHPSVKGEKAADGAELSCFTAHSHFPLLWTNA